MGKNAMPKSFEQFPIETIRHEIIAIKYMIVPYPNDVKSNVSAPINNKIPEIILADLIFGPHSLNNKKHNISMQSGA